MFSGCTVPPHSKKTELGRRDQEVSLLAGKNTEIVIVPCRLWKCVPKAVFVGATCYNKLVCRKSQKKTPSKIGVFGPHNLPFLIFTSFLTQ